MITNMRDKCDAIVSAINDVLVLDYEKTIFRFSVFVTDYDLIKINIYSYAFNSTSKTINNIDYMDHTVTEITEDMGTYIEIAKKLLDRAILEKL